VKSHSYWRSGKTAAFVVALVNAVIVRVVSISDISISHIISC